MSKLAVDDQKISDLLRELGAWHTGHFLLASGLHSNQYLQCQRILQYPRHGMVLAEELARRILEAGHKPTAVVGPALGAVHWELLVAMALDKAAGGNAIKAIFAERPTGTEFEIRRGVELLPGEEVLVVEDVTTTGGSARKVVDLVKSLGADPIAVGAVVDRSGGTVDFGIPFYALVKLNLETFAPEECRWCKEGQPLVKPGSSKK